MKATLHIAACFVMKQKHRPVPLNESAPNSPEKACKPLYGYSSHHIDTCQDQLPATFIRFTNIEPTVFAP